MFSCKRWVGMAAVAVLSLGSVLLAAEPAPIIVTTEAIHCPNCVKKVVANVSKVRGVAKVQVNMEKGIITVALQGPQLPAPRVIWEAVERADVKPVRLQGPVGTFTAKPPA